MQESLKLGLGMLRSDGDAEIEDWMLKTCKTEQAAMRVGMHRSLVFWTFDEMAKELGFCNGSTLNQMLNCDRSDRIRHMGRQMQVDFQRLCGNHAIDRWAALYEQGQLDHQVGAERLENRRKIVK